MCKKQQIEKLSLSVTDMHSKLMQFKDIIGNNYLDDIKKLNENFIKDAKSKSDKNRLLKIVVIGQIKRGKSSFLNALLFNGESILPKAATPMTAALTKIKYSEQIKAEIHFYSDNDWASVATAAEEARQMKANKNFDIPAENKACLEIFNNALESGIISSIGKEPEILDGINSIDNLINKLENYVGSGGKYTPIVKSTELSLNIESLKGIEIVDTPGTNDPVISRSRITQDFIGECDAVFFLSLCSQFLDSNDMSLLAQNIPDKGIKNVFLVGSLFDTAMYDEYKKFKNIKELIHGLRAKYEKRAKNEISEKSVNAGNQDKIILETLQKASDSFFCISSMCFNMAQHFDSLQEDEKFHLNKLNNLYNSLSFDKNSLMVISNLKAAEDKLLLVKSKKKEILSQALSSVLYGAESGYKNLIKNIKSSVQNDYDMFMGNDIVSLDKKQKIIEKTMTLGKQRINNIFKEYSIKVEKEFATVKHDIKASAANSKRISTKTGSKTKSYEVSTSNWYNPFSWFSTETRYKTVTYRYADVNDAISQLENFIINAEGQLCKIIKGIIDIEQFRKKLLNSVNDLFDKSDDEFDPMEVIQTLNNAVNRVTVPDININCTKHISKIRDKFKASTVKGSEIDSLRSEQGRVLSLITNDLNDEIETQTNNIINKLHTVNNKFMPELMISFNTKIEKMKKDKLANDRIINSYKTILKITQKV